MSELQRKLSRLGLSWIAVVLLAVGWGSSLQAEPKTDSAEVMAMLARLEVEDAGRALERLSVDAPGYGYAAALYAFHRGDYQAGLGHLPAQGVGPAELEERVAWLRQRLSNAARAVEGMVEVADEHFLYRYVPGPDSLLPGYARATLEQQRTYLESLYGAAPRIPIVVEFFADESSFVLASGLPAEWVRTTGTVAICKWDRILALSPRSMPRGYAWKDTLAHEYVHLALARASKNKAPVWFHEGSAKLLESAWRDPVRRDFIGPWAESLLARAVAEDQLVGFDAMHPSMAALPSSELAALAFAQVAWAVNYIFEQAGEDGYRSIVSETARHGDVLRAIGAVLAGGGRDFEKSYSEFLSKQELQIRAQVAGIELGLGEKAGTSEDKNGEDLDPILLEHRAMQDHARLGDLLRLRGRLRAALLEYERAASKGPYHSPALANKRARALRGLGKVGEARRVLEASIALYPEFTPTVSLLAQLAAQEGDGSRAIQMGERALGLNPFDPAIHRVLADAYEKAGRPKDSVREQRALRVLQGGVESPTKE